MKKLIVALMIVCVLFAGCGGPQESSEPAVTVNPLPDATMENLTDSSLAISLEEGGAYVDDTGKMQMDVKIYSYDKYDIADIAALKEGDTIVVKGENVEVTSVETNEEGIVLVNGGLENDGFDLVTDDSTIFYITGYNDAKNWQQVGEETLRVSTEFLFTDNSDPAKGEMVYYPGDFLYEEPIIAFDFTPLNTTIRLEEGQIVAMDRIFTP